MIYLVYVRDINSASTDLGKVRKAFRTLPEAEKWISASWFGNNAFYIEPKKISGEKQSELPEEVHVLVTYNRDFSKVSLDVAAVTEEILQKRIEELKTKLPRALFSINRCKLL